MPATQLRFEHGTLSVLVADDPAAERALAAHGVPDPRTRTLRAPAHAYRDVVLGLKAAGVAFEDHAKRFEPIELPLATPIAPFPHQAEALERWWRGGRRGVVELPTGSGKTFLALLAIERVGRPTLVVVPTIELMVQWARVMEERFGRPVGTIGGGTHQREQLTVITYDSAQAQMEHLGASFGLLVCDECHHLPAPAYRFVAEGCLAPFRLGLTATLQRTDGGERIVHELLGPLAYRVDIRELAGEYLAPYEVRSIPVTLDESEQAEYDAARAEYLAFLRSSGVSLSRPNGWAQFIVRAHQSDEGRAAFASFRRQKRIALTSSGKLDALWTVLRDHRADRVLVFTEDNETVYRLSRRFLLPVITHQTRPPERKQLLSAFAEGTLRVLLTSKVLNEGVDVPDANVGVVLSGNGSVREHVQRLGRILRVRPDKRAVLYEIYTDVAAEAGIHDRRRQHAAYGGDEPSC